MSALWSALWPTWLLAGLGLLAVLALASLWATGRFARRRQGRPSTVRPLAEDTELDALLVPHEAAQAGLSGAALVPDAAEAMRLRLASAHLAGRSLDLLYYIWDDDLSGRLLAQALLDAADRGVRVRMLLDDVNVLGRDPVYRALDRHPRIEVRLFNPIRNRDRGLLRGIEILFAFLPYNRRMHGKLWIADGRLAVTGGRNVGDAYFGILDGPGHDYDDLDIVLAGPVLREAEALFDRFWNSGLAMPIRTLWPGRKTRLRRFRARLARGLAAAGARARLARLALPPPEAAAEALPLARLRWSDRLAFLGDPPTKALGTGRDGWMPQALLPLLAGAERSLDILTPYFVPGPQGLGQLVALARAGVAVRLVTNGLALADNALVHGGYRWYRKRVLAEGVTIHEVAARSGPRRMLHSKAMLVDDRQAFVGSFNFDLRSAFLNTELGVVFDDPALVEDLRAVIAEASHPEAAFTVALDGRFPVWFRGDGPRSRHEPDSSAAKRVLSFLIGHLPIHRFL